MENHKNNKHHVASSNTISHKIESFISRLIAVIFVRAIFLGRKSVAVISKKYFGLPILMESIEMWGGIAAISDQREEKFSQVQTIFKAKARGPEQILNIGRGPPINFCLCSAETFH